MEEINSYDASGRRKFIIDVSKITALSVLTTAPVIALANNSDKMPAVFTVQQVIDIIKNEVPGFNRPTTVDQLRSGNPDQEVTGIVTTMFPTLEVIEKTAKAGANFIIAHETPFYNNNDETEWLKDDDAYKYKIELLNKYKIAIWRFHDYWHAHKPDGIAMGNLIKLGWEKYYNPENPRMITLPQPMTIQAITRLAKEKLNISMVRLVGDLTQQCTTVYLAFGYMDPRAQIPVIQKNKPDLILSGETREWETVERVRDGLHMNMKTSLLILSHSVSEEAGMEYAAKWLQPKVPGVKIVHIASGIPYQFI
jgi:putative NIF3 family GTP cyclohydrolase 1 type 2